MSDPFLTRAELRRITCRVKAVAQRKALERLGVRVVGTDAEGYPLVLREAYFGQAGPGERSDEEPNFSRIFSHLK